MINIEEFWDFEFSGKRMKLVECREQQDFLFAIGNP